MKGLELSELFFRTVGQQALEEAFPDLYPRMAIGLAGEGSECFGFDDALSQDHDWGAGFCIWLSREDYETYGAQVEACYRQLPVEAAGLPLRREEPTGHNRVGCLCTPLWYQGFTGLPQGPQTLPQWRRLPHSFLATATNGRIFHDPTGDFTKVRTHLLEDYPEDVRVKKMAYHAAVMAQSGQYNHPRCLKRGEVVAAQLALAEFTKSALAMAYLLNHRYAPYYKWMHRGLSGMAVLPKLSHQLQSLTQGYGVQHQVEVICQDVAQALRTQNLSQSTSDFLLDHCPHLMGHITDDALRSSHILEE